MKTKLFLLTIAFLTAQSCIRAPAATMTDSYVEAANLGQFLRIVELDEVQMDDSLGYPVQEQAVRSYLLAYRKDKTTVQGNEHVKIFFNKRNAQFNWKVYDDLFSANFHFEDTINIKPFTWYKLATDKYGFYIYFFFNGKKNEYGLKIKPKPGAF